MKIFKHTHWKQLKLPVQGQALVEVDTFSNCLNIYSMSIMLI